MLSVYTAAVCTRKPNYTALAVPQFGLTGENMPMGYSDNIATLRRKAGLTQAQLAEKMNVEQPTVQRWETGKRELTVTNLVEIARALAVEPGLLLSQESLMPVPLGPTLYCKGKIAAGRWKPAVEDPHSEWVTFTGRPDITADVSMRFGLKVEGDSMDLLYPDGTVVECVSVFGGAEIAPGKRVIVVRTNISGLFEATVKELAEDAQGKLWAIPRSSNPSHRAISLTEPDEGIVETRIAAIVVASHRPE